MERIKVAVLISGRGSNLKALIEACKNKDFPAKISLVISNKESAKGLQIAQDNSIKTEVINHKSFNNREEFDRSVNEILEKENCQIVCLAGFMRILSPYFVNKWKGKMINIHPSLLPSFKGDNAVEDAINYGVQYSGCTVHYVDEEVDCGKIITQEIVKVLESDTKEILADKILEKEHLAYPRALEIICKEL